MPAAAPRAMPENMPVEQLPAIIPQHIQGMPLGIPDLGHAGLLGLPDESDTEGHVIGTRRRKSGGALMTRKATSAISAKVRKIIQSSTRFGIWLGHDVLFDFVYVRQVFGT